MNTLKPLFTENKPKPYRLADQIGMARNTVYALKNCDDFPDGTRLETLRKIANGLGYTVKIEFVPND